MELVISIENKRNKHLLGNKKCKSIIDFPIRFVVFDFETTGLDRFYDDIIEIGALKIENGIVVESFSSLIKPPNPIDSFITELTGITNEMVADAPDINTVMPKFLDFSRGLSLVGHNVSFDIGFLCSNTDELIDNDYIDTLRICRKLYPKMPHHRLSDMISTFNISIERQHRATDDCYATLNLFEICKRDAIEQFGDIDNFIASFKRKSKHKSIDVNKIIANTNSFDEESIFYEKECVFTGTLEKMKRADAMQLVVNTGGRVGNNVTKKTNYLILGNNDYCKSIKGGKSNKQKKAEQLRLKGQDIEIISEQTFYEVLDL